MRVLLINPPQPAKDLKSAFSKGRGFVLPYSLLCLGTYLRQGGIEAEIIDCVAEGITLQDIAKLVQNKEYDVAGITGFTFSIPRAYETAEIIKKHSSKTKVVIGGIHASVLPRETLKECPWCDYIVIGEGEKVLLSLVNKIKNNDENVEDIPNLAYRKNGAANSTPLNPCQLEINELPIPDYSMLKMPLYVPHSGNYKVLPTYTFYASRGCPFKCSFCSASIVLGKKVRYKTIDNVINEIKLLIKDYKVKGLNFQDSTFTLNKGWVKEFCNRLIEENINLVWRANTRADCIDTELAKLMKKVGCHRINIGFESGNQKTLDLLKKGTTVEKNLAAARSVQNAGLELGASFIIGIPGETIEDVLDTINFAKRIGGKFTQFYLPIPYYGTELRKLCSDGIRKDAPWRDYNSRDFTNAVYINRNFDEDIFKKLPEFAYREFYCNLEAVRRILFSIKSIDEFKDSLNIMKVILKKWRSPDIREVKRIIQQK